MRPRAPQLELSSSARGENGPSPKTQRTAEGTRRQSAPLWRWLGRGGVLVLLALAGCVPPTPAQKATDAARELNMGARWGRMNEAIGRAAPKAQAEFAKRRANWHDKLRIVETELTSLNMKDAMHATVQVDVSWMFDDDPTLRVTRLTQEWSDADGKWLMVSEKKIGGDPGLFGEKVKKAEKPRDTHFPSRVIH